MCAPVVRIWRQGETEALEDRGFLGLQTLLSLALAVWPGGSCREGRNRCAEGMKGARMSRARRGRSLVARPPLAAPAHVGAVGGAPAAQAARPLSVHHRIALLLKEGLHSVEQADLWPQHEQDIQRST